MDPIKDAFSKVKEDIQELKDHLSIIYKELDELKRTLNNNRSPTDKPTDQYKSQQYNPNIPLDPFFLQTDISTYNNNLALEGLKTPNSNISTGNEGVPTDRQTNQQTNQQTNLYSDSSSFDQLDESNKLSKVLSSLDSITTELKNKFSSLTSQEMLIYTTIYQLEEENFIVDYPLVAKKLSLSESSIRDYIIKITKKQIPLIKTKKNNKKITLSIPKEVKKMASINTLISLKDNVFRYTD